MTFADFIKNALEQAGLTNYKLAKRLGMSQTTIANWANGVTEPHDKRRAEVLALFGVSENDLKNKNVIIHYQEKDASAIPHAQFREILSEGGIRLLLDEDANVPDENIEDIIKYIRLRQGQVGR